MANQLTEFQETTLSIFWKWPNASISCKTFFVEMIIFFMGYYVLFTLTIEHITLAAIIGIISLALSFS